METEPAGLWQSFSVFMTWLLLGSIFVGFCCVLNGQGAAPSEYVSIGLTAAASAGIGVAPSFDMVAGTSVAVLVAAFFAIIGGQLAGAGTDTRLLQSRLAMIGMIIGVAVGIQGLLVLTSVGVAGRSPGQALVVTFELCLVAALATALGSQMLLNLTAQRLRALMSIRAMSAKMRFFRQELAGYHSYRMWMRVAVTTVGPMTIGLVSGFVGGVRSWDGSFAILLMVSMVLVPSVFLSTVRYFVGRAAWIALMLFELCFWTVDALVIVQLSEQSLTLAVAVSIGPAVVLLMRLNPDRGALSLASARPVVLVAALFWAQLDRRQSYRELRRVRQRSSRGAREYETPEGSSEPGSKGSVVVAAPREQPGNPQPEDPGDAEFLAYLRRAESANVIPHN